MNNVIRIITSLKLIDIRSKTSWLTISRDNKNMKLATENLFIAMAIVTTTET